MEVMAQICVVFLVRGFYKTLASTALHSQQSVHFDPTLLEPLLVDFHAHKKQAKFERLHLSYHIEMIYFPSFKL